ncbi:MAG: DMT family transporter [Candidatus Bathyarchaeia archaeon]
MELWFVLAIAVAFLWGADGILAKLTTQKLGVARVAVLIVVVDGLTYFLGFYYWRDNLPIGLGDGVLAAISCIVGTVAYLCYFESIVDGQIAIAGTISAAYPALTVIGALLLLSETLTATQAIALTAIIGGVVALSYEPNPGAEHAMPRRSLFFALLAFALWGFWGLTSKMAINAIGPGNILGFYVISSAIVPIAYTWFRRVRPVQSRDSNPSWNAWALGATALALNVCGVFAFSFALNAGSASLVVPISSAYPLVTVILAVALLHEKLDRLHVIAFVFVIIGLIVIGVTG